MVGSHNSTALEKGHASSKVPGCNGMDRVPPVETSKGSKMLIYGWMIYVKLTFILFL